MQFEQELRLEEIKIILLFLADSARNAEVNSKNIALNLCNFGQGLHGWLRVIVAHRPAGLGRDLKLRQQRAWIKTRDRGWP
jgi:hypothetical protein